MNNWDPITELETNDSHLYRELKNAIGNRTINFIEADGVPVVLDTVYDDENIEVEVLYPDLSMDTNVGTLYVNDVITDEDDLYTLIDTVNDYSDSDFDDFNNFDDFDD